MTFESRFEQLWDNQEFHLPEEDQANSCVFAEKFAAWLEPKVNEAVRKNSHEAINQVKILALDKYFEFRAVVPKSHRFSVREESHLCIWHIFEHAFQQLKAAELALTPPILYLPEPAPPPAPPPPPQIAGIFIGEAEDDE